MKKVQIRPKKNFWGQKNFLKNPEFHADFKSVEKVKKKKSYKQYKFDEHE
jgi:hypothetical protein